MKTRLSPSLRGWLASILTVLLVASGVSIGSLSAVAATAPQESTAPAAGGEVTGDPSENTVTPVTYEVAGAPAPVPTSPPAQASDSDSAPEPTAAALSVSKVSGLDPDGETITVTGTNIETDFANRHGPGKAGLYAQIGYLDSSWRPSQGAPSDARSNAYSTWVKEAAMGADGYLVWTDNGDGTADFSWEVEVEYDALESVRRAGSTLAVFTLGGGGTVQSVNELAVPISFNVPSVSVSKTTNLDSTGETITITGSGFLPHAPETNGARPPLAGKFAGTYVVFGKFPDVWQPSKGADSSARKTPRDMTKWAVHEGDMAAIGGPASGAVKLDVDGNFTATIAVKKGFIDEPATGNYGIYTYSGSGAAYTRFETYTPLSFTPLATDLTFTTSPVGQATVGESVTLRAKLASPTPGSIKFSAGSTNLGSAATGSDGTATLVAKSLPIGTHALKAEFTPADPTSFVGSSSGLSYTVIAKPVAVTAAGSLTWGVKQSFRDYVSGPIAAGSISTTNVRSTGSAFVFGQASGGTFNGSTGTSNYTGSVRFLGHGGILDLTLSNPVVRVDSANSGTLLLRVNGATVPFATARHSHQPGCRGVRQRRVAVLPGRHVARQGELRHRCPERGFHGNPHGFGLCLTKKRDPPDPACEQRYHPRWFRSGGAGRW